MPYETYLKKYILYSECFMDLCEHYLRKNQVVNLLVPIYIPL